jgi:phospholipid/cholesterol/gamma-HCH transport system permease protein
MARVEAMASAGAASRRAVAAVGGSAFRFVAQAGDLALFAGVMFAWLMRRRPGRGTLLPSLYYVGVRSVPVVAVTGVFIGMVLAVNTYRDFKDFGLATRMGAIINTSVLRELGPVLAATMIAGRVGSAMAAELGTMRVTEQIDALSALGVNATHHLVVPRFLACVLLIPLLTVLADFMGILGGAAICTRLYHIEPHHYWSHAREFTDVSDVVTGLIKSVFFGGSIALISCHRGFNCRPGAEGVGRAATEAFVTSFIVILVLDFFLAILLNRLAGIFWPSASTPLL